MHKKLIGSIIECAFVENLSVLRGPSGIPFESFPTPWNPFADSSFALLTDPLSPLVEIFFPFPTFGGSLLSFLQPLSGPSSSFVPLRGFLFLAFVDNPQLFQASPAPALPGGSFESETGVFQASRAPALPCGSFEEETFSWVCQNRCKGVAPAVKPRLGIGAPCPKASLGPSRPSFISEASPEALLKVRIRTTTPSRAGAASSRHHLVTVPLPVG